MSIKKTEFSAAGKDAPRGLILRRLAPFPLREVFAEGPGVGGRGPATPGSDAAPRKDCPAGASGRRRTGSGEKTADGRRRIEREPRTKRFQSARRRSAEGGKRKAALPPPLFFSRIKKTGFPFGKPVFSDAVKIRRRFEPAAPGRRPREKAARGDPRRRIPPRPARRASGPSHSERADKTRFGKGGSYIALTIPPSTSTVWPVMNVFNGAHRNAASLPYSSGRP